MRRRGLAAAALLAIALGGLRWRRRAVGRVPERLASRPGIEAAGKRAERQGGPDPDAGEEIFQLRPREGETIGYAVAVRNVTDREISVTGVEADEDRDGAFVPESVAGAPVEIPPGERAQVEVEGTVHGCRVRRPDGPAGRTRAGDAHRGRRAHPGSSTLDIRVELVVEEGC